MNPDNRKFSDFNFADPLSAEPWVRLPDAGAIANWDEARAIAYNQQNRQHEKYRFFVKAFDYLTGNQIEGDYHEYGCHRGRTMRMALSEARRHNRDDSKFYAFDSFAGLPEVNNQPDYELWRQGGALTTSEADFMAMIEAHGIYADRVVPIKGFYDDSLTTNLQERLQSEGRKIALACIDCDLYESAVPVFEFMEPLLQDGCIIYIDDLFAGYHSVTTEGIAKAFLDFQAQSDWKFLRHMDVGWWGRSYIASRQLHPLSGNL
ncbi:MAG: hypothetical protein HN834_14885 [Rhodospirillaceae bacterium]|jgi:hypothetical protein|nr:hypothetical protein [Rhodospirillaceae bacterium]MBT5079436.1 hypothetical protein [Rhodospirillaceae bacterium]MBT5878449.1 hypothetical protein [Rhodospirillaceae bacterium]MBT6590111.1 hypothetical protein [Rhodospirillaceae bacterium]MBT7286734.1 hypothetical protein [Rhodospirillaceae bacterium]